MSVTDLPAATTAGAPTGPPEPARPTGRGRRRRRLIGWYVLTVFALVTLNFFLPRTMPNDPIDALTAASASGRGGVQIDDAARAKLAHYYGLDRPLVSQYGHYLAGLAHGDLGFSIRYNVPVSRLMGDRLKWTALLVATSIAIAATVGMLGGINSGWRRGRRLDSGLLGFFTCLGSVPPYVIGSFALILLGVKLRWFPLAGAQTPFVHYGFFPRILDVARHLALPASVMALQFIFLTFLVMRGGMVSELGSDYLLVGRAKGIRDRGLKYRYAARNALLPVVTALAVDIGIAISGSVFVERIFGYPGLGGLMFSSIDYRDYPTMQGCFLVMSLVVVSVNLVTDLAYPRIDPRVVR